MKTSFAGRSLLNRIFMYAVGIGTVCLGVAIGRGSYEMTHSSLSFWLAAIFGVFGGMLLFVPYARMGKIGPQPLSPGAQSVEDRLDELERLKRREMVTPEEYAAKRTDILKDL